MKIRDQDQEGTEIERRARRRPADARQAVVGDRRLEHVLAPVDDALRAAAAVPRRRVARLAQEAVGRDR